MNSSWLWIRFMSLFLLNNNNKYLNVRSSFSVHGFLMVVEHILKHKLKKYHNFKHKLCLFVRPADYAFLIVWNILINNRIRSINCPWKKINIYKYIVHIICLTAHIVTGPDAYKTFIFILTIAWKYFLFPKPHWS